MNLPSALFEIKIVLPVVLRWSGLKICLRCLGFVFQSGVGCDPVHFPSLASIIGEGLLKAARIRSDVRDDKSNQDGPVIQGFLVIKLAASIFEFANRRLGQRASAAAGKIQSPLMRLRIVEAQV